MATKPPEEDAPEWHPPEVLWLLKKRSSANGQMETAYFTDDEAALKALKTLEHSGGYGTTYEVAIWKLSDGYWVPYSFGYVLAPAGEGE